MEVVRGRWEWGLRPVPFAHQAKNFRTGQLIAAPSNIFHPHSVTNQSYLDTLAQTKGYVFLPPHHSVGLEISSAQWDEGRKAWCEICRKLGFTERGRGLPFAHIAARKDDILPEAQLDLGP